MLRQVAEGVLIHASAFMQSNAVVVQGGAGGLLIDPGVTDSEMACLANDLRTLGQPVVAGFSTHPHWDHLLWTPGLGEAPRYATARCAETARAKLPGGLDPERAKAVGVPDDVPLDLIGALTGRPDGATQIPWDGPGIRIIEHDAHAAGHAALLIEERRVLVAGDMLSDVLVPMLDMSAADPVEDYLDALGLLGAVADDVAVLVPGHGSVAEGDEVRGRLEMDRVYVEALRDATAVSDPRAGDAPEEGWDWVAGVDERQRQQLADRRNVGGAG